MAAHRAVPQQFAHHGAHRVDVLASEQQPALRSDEVEGAGALGVPDVVVGVEVLRQRRGVLEPQVQGQSADGHLGVRGVARQEDPAAAVLARLAAGVVEDVLPDGEAVADVLPGDVPPGRRDVVETVAGDHDPCRAVRPPVGRGESAGVPLEPAAGDVDALDVGAQQLRGRVRADELEPRQPADGAVLAVAAGDPPGGHPVPAAA